MKEELVYFKGTKEGVYICVEDGKFADIKKELEKKLEESISFFESGQIIGIKGKKLLSSQKAELIDIIKNKYKLNFIEKEIKEEEKDKFKFYNGINEGMTKFVINTFRSGQALSYSGNIVIIGDVNPGAYIMAAGNIVVLGNMRGIAHAGFDGNRKAIVAAYSLQPTQLRIADIIARCPDDYLTTSKTPEIARIYNGEVLIEPYLSKNKK